MATKRVFSKAKQTPPSSEAYVESLDPLLKKNTGQFTNVGYDTSSNTPYLLPNANRVRQGQGLEGGINSSPLYDTPSSLGQTDRQYQYLRPGVPANNEAYQTSAQDLIRKLTQPQEARALGSLQDGGVYYSNGIIKYEDGTERAGDPNAFPVQSMVNGGIGYSDGSVRKATPEVIMELKDGMSLFSDGTVRYSRSIQGNDMNSFQNAMFGENYPITQEYGNYNPELEPTPSGRNVGLDIGVYNQPITAPFRGVVVQRFFDDGTRFGSQSGHKGYGNSVLVQLETGEMLRFSHLSNTDLEVGQEIQPGMVIGTTGATGNVTAAHLDLEYYDANGRISNPENLSLLANNSLQEGGIVSLDELEPEIRETVERYNQTLQSAPRGEYQTASPEGQVLGQQTQGQFINQAPDTGVSKLVADAGRTIGAREYGVSEQIGDTGQLFKGQITPEAYATNTLNRGEQTAGVIGLPEANIGELARREVDAGFSEFASGNLPQGAQNLGRFALGLARENNLPDYGASEAAQKVGQFANNLQPNLSNAFQGAVLGVKDLAANGNPFNPPDANAQGEFNTNQPIGDKVNQSLINDRVLTALENIKSTFNVAPQRALDTLGKGSSLVTNAVEGGRNALEGATQGLGGTVQRVGERIADTFDGENEGDDSLLERASTGVASVFKKATSSSKSSSKSSNKSSSKSSSSKSSSKPVTVAKNNIPAAVAKKESKGAIPQSSSTNPKAANYVNQSKAPNKSVGKPSAPKTPTVFKKVTSAIKNLFRW